MISIKFLFIYLRVTQQQLTVKSQEKNAIDYLEHCFEVKNTYDYPICEKCYVLRCRESFAAQPLTLTIIHQLNS